MANRAAAARLDIADLGVDVLHVVLRRPPGDHQPLGDLGVAAPPATSRSTSTSRSDSPPGLAGRTGAARGRPRRARRCTASASRASRRGRRSSRCRSACSGAIAGGVAGAGSSPGSVRRRQHPRRHGQLRSRAAAVVAAAVEPFVVPPDQRRERRQPLRSGQDAFGVVRVQPHLFPLAVLSRPGFSHTALETATRPTSCSRPATSRSADGGRGRPQPLGRAAGQRGDAAEWPCMYGVFRSARSPNTPATSTQVAASGIATTGAGSASSTASAGVSGVDLAEQRGGAVGEMGRHVRIEHAAAAAPHRVDGRGRVRRSCRTARRCRPAARPGTRSECRRRPTSPDRPGPATSRRRGRRCAAPPPAGPGGGPRATDLAGRGGERRPEAAPAGDRGEGQPRAFQWRPPLRQRRRNVANRSRGSARSVRPAAALSDELVAEDPGRLVGVPGAARRGAAARCRRPPGPPRPAGRATGPTPSRASTSAAPHRRGARTPGRRGATGRPAGRPAVPLHPPRPHPAAWPHRPGAAGVQWRLTPLRRDGPGPRS